MKIYAKFPRALKNWVSLWFQHIPEQIKETMPYAHDLLDDDSDSDYDYCWDPEKIAFPFFIQDDMHKYWITTADHDRPYYITYGEYQLLFLWEPDDFLWESEYEDEEEREEAKNDSQREFARLLNNVGLKSEEDIKIPDGFVYLGRYLYNQKEPLTLPGLVSDPECEEGAVLADCMFNRKYFDVDTDVLINGKHVGLTISLPKDDAETAMHLFDEAIDVLRDIDRKDIVKRYTIVDSLLREKSPELYDRILAVLKKTIEEEHAKNLRKYKERAKELGMDISDKDQKSISVENDDILIGCISESFW